MAKRVRLSRRAAVGVARFREDQHRRDSGGKFADKPGAGDDAPKKHSRRATLGSQRDQIAQRSARVGERERFDKLQTLPDGSRPTFGDWSGKYRITDEGALEWDNPSATAKFVASRVSQIGIDPQTGLNVNPLHRVEREPLPENWLDKLNGGRWRIVKVNPSEVVSAQTFVNGQDLVKMTSVDPTRLPIDERTPVAILHSSGKFSVINGNHRASLYSMLGQPIYLRVID